MRKRSPWTGVLGAAVALTMVARPAFAVEETKIGVTSASNLTTTGFPPVSPEHLLKIGVEVVGDERIVTTKDGRAQLLFLDHSALTVGPNSDVVLDKFIYDPDAGVGELAFSATQGIFRLVGGRISKKTPVTIKTPTATLSIRGGVGIVSIQERRVEATFLFGQEMAVCTDTLPERERPRHERPGERCLADGQGKYPEGTQRSSIGTERCKCVTATRPGSLVTIPSLGNVLDPVVLSAERLSRIIEQLEPPPGKPTDTAVLVFQQDVKDAVLGALAEPAAGPGGGPNGTSDPPFLPPPPPCPDCVKISGEDGATPPPPPPPPPLATNLSGGYASEPRVINIAFQGFDGTENPARNFVFDDGTIANDRFTATLVSPLTTASVDLPVNQLGALFAFGSAGTVTPFGPVTGSGFVTGNADFLVYLLQETQNLLQQTQNLLQQTQNNNNLAGLFGGIPLPAGLFPTTGFAAHDIVLNGFAYQPTALLGGTDQVGAGPTAIPFLTPAAGGDIPNAFVSPIFSAFNPNLSTFPDNGRSVALQASLAIDGQYIAGQSAAQRSALSISTLTYFAETPTNALVIAGGTRGTGRAASNARTRRISSGLSSPQDGLGNAFFGDVATMGFALDSDSFSGLTQQASLGAERGHSFNPPLPAQGDFTAVDFLAGAVRTAGPADLGIMRGSQTLNGYAAGIMESLSKNTTVFSDFAFGNTNNSPFDVSIVTDAATNRLEAEFNVFGVALEIFGTVLIGRPKAYTISFGKLTGPNRARSAFIDDSRFAARENPVVPGRLNGVDGTFTRAAMVTQKVVPADNFLPSGVSFCQCEYLRWGYWNLDLVVNPGEIAVESSNVAGNPGPERDRTHVATWVAGKLAQITPPFAGTATFLGHLIGNVKNAGNFYVAAGGFQQDWNFLTRTGATTITQFDGVDFAGTASSANGRDIAGTFANAASGRTGALNASFFSGGGNPTGYLGGQFGITGTDYLASGTVAAKQVLAPIPEANQQ